MLTIIDYGVGNLTSIKNMLRKVGYHDILISNNEAEIASSKKLILPGVGHFDYGMIQLRNSKFYETLNRKVLDEKVPILGICLGAQLLTQGSEEGDSPGLGWIEAKTIKFRPEKMEEELKIPHMGWGEIVVKKESKLLQGIPEVPRYYFVHNYHIMCDDVTDEIVACHYGYEFTAGIERGNILGVQFHPEKSHKYGMKLLLNFVENY